MSWSKPTTDTTEEALLELLTRLDSVREEFGWGAPAWLVEIVLPADGGGGIGEADGTGPALCILPPGLHPLVALDGFVAPPEWGGIGVVCEGATRDLATGRRNEGDRARVIHLVARDGTTVNGLRQRGQPLHVTVGSGVEGDIPAALRRALGLPAASGGVRC
ncbi:MAG TPA: hypothetical protein VFA94_03925 [Acidimicrobiales bacterium]|nr:hypothetical protein [Acidimicrobiales bacterium]